MKIESLYENVKKTAKALEDEMQKQWPVGSIIEVKLNSRQINPTSMKVYSHNGFHATVRAGMESKNARLGNYVRDIYYKYIL